MGAEVGATTSIFPFDEKSAAYLEGTGRKEVADEARKIIEYLQIGIKKEIEMSGGDFKLAL